jgi:hypothetical protein
MPKPQKTVMVVDWEIAEVSNAVQGAALLIELGTTSQLANEDQERVAPRAAAAILNLAVTRMRALQRALRGDLDPTALFTGFNTLPDSADLQRDHVTVLRPWVEAARTTPKSKRGKKP